MDPKLGVSNVFVIGKDTLKSDEGVVSSNLKEQEFFTARSLTHEYTLVTEQTPAVARLVFNATMLNERHQREYKKIQTLLAEVAAIGKVFSLIFKFFVDQTNKFALYKRNIASLKNQSKNSGNQESSIANLRDKKLEEDSLPSFWEYLFLSKVKFNKKYVSKAVVESELDISQLRIEIDQLKSNRSVSEFRLAVN